MMPARSIAEKMQSANKASQRDTKTAASLWFSCPCWRRYKANMKSIVSIWLLLLAHVSNADTFICFDNKSKTLDLSLKEASEIGFTYKIHGKEKVNNTYCRVINIVSLGKMENQPFLGISLTLESSSSPIGQFSLSPTKYVNNEHYGAVFEVCEGNIEITKTTFSFGERCNVTSYAIEVKPWNL